MLSMKWESSRGVQFIIRKLPDRTGYGTKVAGSSHRMVRSFLKVPVRLRKALPPTWIPPDYDKDALAATISLELQAAPIEEDAKVELNQIKKAFLKCAETCKVQQPLTGKLSEGTLSLLDRRRQMKFGLNNSPHALVEYSEICKLARRSLEEDLKEHHIKVMQKAISQNRLKRGRYELVEKRGQPVSVKRRDGRATASMEETLEEIRDFYTELYHSEDGDFLFQPDPNIEHDPITVGEMTAAAHRMKPNTSPGFDNVPSKVVKYTTPVLAERLTQVMNQMLQDQALPPELLHARTILIHKKGDRQDIANYRPISLLPVLYKLLTRIITERIVRSIERSQSLPPEQAGFRRSYSTVCHIQAVNQLLEKSREYSLPLHAVFLDFQKAFDSIELNAIWNALETYGIDPSLIQLVKIIYAGGTSAIKVGTNTIPITIQKGVRQGDTLSPILFIITLQSALDRVNWNNGINIEGKKLGYLAFADDVVLLSRSLTDLQRMVQEMTEKCAEVGLKVNVGKTKWMTNAAPAETNITIAGQNIERVTEFTYLGQLIKWPAVPKRFSKEISKRISSAWNAFRKAKHLLSARRVSMDLKRRYFHQCVVPAMLYGCETWALTKEEENRLEIAERRMERRILNIRLEDKKPNDWIRMKTGFDSVVHLARRRKFTYLPKLLQLPDDRWNKILTLWKPRSKRPVGRPPTRWIDDIQKFCGDNNISNVLNPANIPLLNTLLLPYVFRER